MTEQSVPSTPEELKKFVTRHFEEMLNGGRPDLAPLFFHPEMKVERMGIQKAAEFLIRRRAKARGEELGAINPGELFGQMGPEIGKAFPDVHIIVGQQLCEGDLVVTRVTFTATHSGDFFGAAPTGNKIAFSEVLFMRVTEGKISEVFALGDEFAFLEQLEASPS